MTFNTKLNIGDTVWHISTREGCIKQTTITGVTIVHKPTDYCQGECETKVIYESNDNHNFAEESEGHYWWSTRRGIIDYLTKTLKSVGNGKKSNPIAAPSGDSLSEAFEEFFNSDLPKRPRETVRINLPPRIPRGVSTITEGLDKKTVKGTMGGKEFVGRFKKLPGIREKTLTDYADEL